MSQPILWQFSYSHFNEKARWALDYKGVEHERRSFLPGLHIPPLVFATGQKRVPVLRIGRELITDSTRIIARLESDHPNPPLYPADDDERVRALALEELFDEELGPPIRLAWFHEILKDADYACALFTIGATRAAKRFFRVLFPILRSAMRMDMKIGDGTATRARAQTLQMLDRIEEERAGSAYLVGDRFTVADLTAAALLSPVMPDDVTPFRVDLRPPPEAEAFRQQLLDHPAVEWAAGVFTRHRHPPAA